MYCLIFNRGMLRWQLSVEFSYATHGPKMRIRTGAAITVVMTRIQVDKTSLSEYIVFKSANVRLKSD